MAELTDRDQKALDLGLKMMEVTDNYRCLSPESYAVYGTKGYRGSTWTDESILSHLNRPQYAGIRWRYLRTAEMKAYQKVITSIPISTVFDTFNTLVRPIYTDFVETTENLEFLEFSANFYYQLFIQETVYVSYQFFENSENFKLSQGSVNKDIKKKIEKIKEKGGFDMWVKMNEDEYDENEDFMHIDTSIVIRIPNWRKKVVRVKWGAVYHGNFVNWYNTTVTYLALTNFMESMLRLSGKRLLITTGGRSEKVVARLQGMIESFDTHLHLDIADVANLRELKYMDGDLLKEIRNTVYHFLDRLMAEYGRVANTNPKGERMTTMEQYKDLSAIANRQKETLNQLDYLAVMAKKLWKVDLEFAISGIPEKEALFTVSHRAQNPNSESHYFGQTEGTQMRVPRGQKTPPFSPTSTGPIGGQKRW